MQKMITRIEVNRTEMPGYEFQNNQKPDDYTYDEENDIYYKTFSCTTEKIILFRADFFCA